MYYNEWRMSQGVKTLTGDGKVSKKISNIANVPNKNFTTAVLRGIDLGVRASCCRFFQVD